MKKEYCVKCGKELGNITYNCSSRMGYCDKHRPKWNKFLFGYFERKLK